MTNISLNSEDPRLNLLRMWLENDLGFSVNELAPASADASFRRYFRARVQAESYIVMDAPPNKEPLDAFIAIDRALIGQSVHAPKIFAQNLNDGFLLLEDMGNTTYLDELNRSQSRADTLYADAIKSLIRCQTGAVEQTDFVLTEYSEQILEQELSLFHDWYLNQHLDVTLSDEQQDIWVNTKQYLIKTCREQPKVWVHRDFHSRNLMVTENEVPGVIDFQDMVVGPISYDLASIFKDCYIRWPRTRQLSWLESYREQACKTLHLSIETKQLIRWYDLTGLQRHLKVLGIFCRLYYRDGKSNYLSDLPMVADYVLEVLALYPELNDFNQTFASLVKRAKVERAKVKLPQS